MPEHQFQLEQKSLHSPLADGPPPHAQGESPRPEVMTAAQRHEHRLQRLREAYEQGFLHIPEDAVAGAMVELMIESSDRWLLLREKSSLRRLSRVVS